MKLSKIILLLFIFISASLNARTKSLFEASPTRAFTLNASQITNSSYKQFLNHTKWLTTVAGFEGNISSIFKVIGDTLYNNHTYKIIEVTYVHLPGIWNDPSIGNGSVNSNMILCREDTIARKVYIAGLNNEALLYDFSLSIGDQNPLDSAFILATKDSVLTPDGYHNRFLFYDGQNNIIWVEGVGSLAQPFQSNVPFSSTLLNQVICAYQNGNLVFDNGNAIPLNCSSFIAVDEILDGSSSLKIFPNPSSGKFILRCTEVSEFIESVEAMDYIGNLIQVDNQPKDKNSTTLDLTSFPKGLFTIIVKTNKRQLREKIVVIK